MSRGLLSTSARFLQTGENCWVKVIGGLVTPCDFTSGEDWPSLFPE